MWKYVAMQKNKQKKNNKKQQHIFWHKITMYLFEKGTFKIWTKRQVTSSWTYEQSALPYM